MKWLTLTFFVVLCLYKLKTVNCSTDISSIVPQVSSHIEIKLTCSSVTSILAVPHTKAAIVVNTLATYPFLSSDSQATEIVNCLTALCESPILFNQVDPASIVAFVDHLNLSSSLLQSLSTATIVKLLTAISTCPSVQKCLPSSALVCLLTNIAIKNPCALCEINSAVVLTLLKPILAPKEFCKLNPTDVANLIDTLINSQCVLLEMCTEMIEGLIKQLVEKPQKLDKILIAKLVCLLNKISTAAPSLISSIKAEVLIKLFIQIQGCIKSLPAETLIDLLTIFGLSPTLCCIPKCELISELLNAVQTSGILCSVSPILLQKLLVGLSLSEETLKIIKPIVLVNLFIEINNCISPDFLCNLPPSTLKVFAKILANPITIQKLPPKTTAKLCELISQTPCLLTKLAADDIKAMVVALVLNVDALNALQPTSIVNLVYYISKVSPILTSCIPEKELQCLFQCLTPITALKAIPSSIFVQLFTTLSICPEILNLAHADLLNNILKTTTESNSLLLAIPSSIHMNVLTHIFTSKILLGKIQTEVLINLLIKIGCNPSTDMLCSLPPCVIGEVAKFLFHDTKALATLKLIDIANLVNLLANCPSFLAQIPVDKLAATLDLAVSEKIGHNGLSINIKIKLLCAIHSFCPGIFDSIQVTTLQKFTATLAYENKLAGLPVEVLTQLVTIVSNCPCLLKGLNPAALQALLDVLSNCPQNMVAISPSVCIDLLTLLGENPSILRTISISSIIKLLCKLSTVNKCTLATIQATVIANILLPLCTLKKCLELTPTDLNCLIDLLIEFPCVIGELPSTITCNLFQCISDDLNALTLQKLIILLKTVLDVAPSLVSTIPAAVRCKLITFLGSQEVLCNLPINCLAALITCLSKSTCLVTDTPAFVLVNILKLLSTSQCVPKDIPCEVYINLLTAIALQPKLIKEIPLTLFISSLLKLSFVSPPVLLSVPPSVICTVFTVAVETKAMVKLGSSDIVLLLTLLTRHPCLFTAIPKSGLNILLTLLLSTPNLLATIPNSLLASFLAALTTVPSALHCVQPAIIVNLLTSLASIKPDLLCGLPIEIVTPILNIFDSSTLQCSLTNSIYNDLLNLILTFENIFNALPLTVLSSMLSTLSISSSLYLPEETLCKLLTLLASKPQVICALSPGLLVSFVSKIVTLFPNILCKLPQTIAVNLVGPICTTTALSTLKPEDINVLIETLNTHSCLLTVLPTAFIVTLIQFVLTHPASLSCTPKYTYNKLLNQIQSPTYIPVTSSSDMGSINYSFNDLTYFQKPKHNLCFVDIDNIEKSYTADNSSGIPGIDQFPAGLPKNAKISTVFAFSKKKKSTPILINNNITARVL